MSEKIERMSDEALGGVAGGMSANLMAAYDVMAGRYGDGEDRKRRLAAAGYDYWSVQHLVNGLAKGYDAVARDVIDGRYGNDQARIRAANAPLRYPAGRGVCRAVSERNHRFFCWTFAGQCAIIKNSLHSSTRGPGTDRTARRRIPHPIETEKRDHTGGKGKC